MDPFARCTLDFRDDVEASTTARLGLRRRGRSTHSLLRYRHSSGFATSNTVPMIQVANCPNGVGRDKGHIPRMLIYFWISDFLCSS